jgi:hypothetical protein
VGVKCSWSTTNQKALDISSACLVMMLFIPCSLRWHYPDQVPTVGDE